MTEQSNSTFSLLLEDVKMLVEKKAELIKLNIADKVANMTSSVAWGVMTFLLFLISILFASISCAWWLGEKLGSIPLGFCILTLFYIVLSIGVVSFGKKAIQELISNFIIKKIVQDNE